MKSLPALGLFRRREVWLPTWRGLLLLFLLVALAGAALLFGLYPFLAQQAPRNGGALVMEGWIDDDSLPEVLQQCRAHPFAVIYTTGHPVEPRSPIREYGTYASYGAARLRELGLPNVIAVPSPPVVRDRTFSSALALRDWMRAHGGPPREITIFTPGPHARRSRLLFQRAFGDEAEIGVVSIAPREYDTHRWWRSSAGFRDVTGEAIAWLYARLLFRPGGE
jgi:hypothetical protein